MAAPAPDPWTDRARDALGRYAEPLLREVATALVRPRTAIPADELADRLLGTLLNPPVIDRRVKELPDPARKALALIGLSRRPTWSVGHLVTALAALGHTDGLEPILTLLKTGLLFPQLPENGPELVAFESWIGWAGTLTAPVFAHPAVAARCRSEPLGLPALESAPLGAVTPRYSDGLDWPLRLAVAWQRVDETPVRLTQANTLFKRDLTRFQADEVLSGPAPDQLVSVADPGVLALFWAKAAGLLTDGDGELRAGPFPPTWATALSPTLSDLWAALAAVDAWDPLRGYAPGDTGLSATPTAGLLALLLLASAPADEWADPQPVADWLWEHHPAWSGTLPKDQIKSHGRGWVEAYLLGVAYPLQLVEAIQTDGWKVRLTAFGRTLLANGPEPAASPAFPQTLLVQPNAEVLVYRQGLTPALIGELSRFAAWKHLGPACTLELSADRTYHGLESGLTLAGIVQTLNRHGMRPVPPAVADLLGRWANKRERITVYPSATLVEFQTPADLEAAVARGLVSVRVTDRIGLTGDGREPEFKHLRLTGNRDYEAKPTRCLTVAVDGVTLTVDAGQSDLLLEAEIGKLADPVAGDPSGVRRFRLTPESVRRALAGGMAVSDLDAWFEARTGGPLTPAGKLFAVGPELPSPTAARHLVLHLPTAELADGLVQWPATADLITDRLGPTAIVVEEEQLEALRAVLAEVGVRIS